MTQGINREYIFEDRKDKLKYFSLLKEYHERYLIKILAYCIMDNHAHLLLYSVDSSNLSLFMKEINLRYATYYNKRHERVGYVFRNRFKSQVVQTEIQVLRCIKYIHCNPVKAGIVEKEEQYEFSSYNEYFQKSKNPEIKIINSKNLNSIFNNQENYLEKLDNVKYEEAYLEKEKLDLRKILEDFLKENNLEVENISKEKIYLKKFISYLISENYKISKIELARVLNISKSKLYRDLK